ncbi:hypothetical protein [Parageobacillus thermoglucosidasius]
MIFSTGEAPLEVIKK